MAFTPLHSFDNRLSTMSPVAHNLSHASPFLGSQTPTPQTPVYRLNTINNPFSPSIGGGNSSMRFNEGRMSGYPGLPNSSSPSYSNRMMSASPNYSPSSSHHSSPSYSPRPDSNRHENESIK